MSTRRIRIEGLRPVSFDDAKKIPGFVELLRLHPSIERNSKGRGGVAWDVIGQLLIRVWREGIEAQRDLIAAEEAARATAAAGQHLDRVIEQARQSLAEPEPRGRPSGGDRLRAIPRRRGGTAR